MKMQLKGFEKVSPKSGKSPFTMLYTSYPKHGVEGEVVESIYIADSFPLPSLKIGMTIDVDRNGKGFILAVTEVEPTIAAKLNLAPKT